ncbi:Cell death protein 3 [Holothuria leucospilota]|uniref:Cell death protein 3 n=1 Tax=Holothuria leucospilota TaxID=206669 RepID=A0A9Q0YH03_HOLLE|nr:Cell death protein 3 [Holothuria leucospilota]
MEDVHRKAIRANYVKLSKDMELDLVMASLIQSGIYEPFMVDTFKAKPGKLVQNQTFLNNIETRGPKAYAAFLNALVEAGQEHLAKDIKSKERPRPQNQFEPMETSNFPSHPTDAGVWPNPEGPAIFEQFHVKRAQVKSEMVDNDEVYRMVSQPRGLAVIINNRTFRTMPERRGTEVDGRNLQHVFKELGFNVETKSNVKAQVYRMSSKPRGLALIINNKHFDSMKTRQGTDIDAKNLVHVFQQLHFNVDVKANVTALEMATIVKEFCKMNHSNFDCVALAILTHGVEGALYGVDEKKLLVEDLLKYFDADRAPTLIGKPKIIILQACRGERFDKGIESTDATGAGYAEEVPPPVEDENADPDALAESMLKLELEAPDAFARFVSWRNSERGSWFIQAFTEVILQYAQSEDLLSMLTKVNAKVAKAFESSSGRNKQMPAPVTMLTKKLFFFPGFFRQ